MKRFLGILLLLSCALSSCGREATPMPAAETVLFTLLEESGYGASERWTEVINETYYDGLGINAEAYASSVRDAVICRPLTDTSGEMICVFRTDSHMAAEALAEALYRAFEFPPCDLAEKLTVACVEECVLLVKADAAEADRISDDFCGLGRRTTVREKWNRG